MYTDMLLYISSAVQERDAIYAWILMADMLSSAVVHEVVSQILSDLISRREGKEKVKVNENLERLEMAHIK